MAVIVPNASEQLWLKSVLNHTAAEDQVLKLFVNNIGPDQNSTASSFTEASGGGYANKTLVGTSWTIVTNTSNEGEATFAAQVFTFTGALDGAATIFGWYLIQQTSGLLLAAENISGTLTPANNGDAITINPKLQLFSEF